MVIIVFVIIFFSLYAAMNYYIGLRCWQALGSQIHFLNQKIYWIVFSLLVSSYVIGRLGHKYLPGLVSNGFTCIGAYWMAAMVYWFLLILLIDCVRWINHWGRFLPPSMVENTFVFRLGLAIVLFGLVLLGWGSWWARNIQTKHYDVTLHKKAGEMKELHAVMISDIHLGNIVNKKALAKLVNGINKLQPDIVFIPGDIIDDDIEPFIRQGMAEEFRRIHSQYGIYACMGNHDYYGGREENMLDQFKKAGITMLKDTSVQIGSAFYITGREDKTYERTSKLKRKPLTQLIEGMDTTLPVFLLDHEPGNLGEAQKVGVDLQLSGHTHQGQLFPGNLITKRVFELDYGYLLKGDLHVIVSSGAGTWGPPIRLGTSSEIVDIRIRFE